MSGVGSFIDLCRGFFGEDPKKTSGNRRVVYSVEKCPVELGLEDSKNVIVRFGNIPPEREGLIQACAQKIAVLYALVIEGKKDLHIQSLVFEMPESMSLKTIGALLPSGISLHQDQLLTPNRTQYATRTHTDFYNKTTRLWVWVDTERPCQIPEAANKHVGAAALVINELPQGKFVFLVRKPSESPFWHAPGGPGERLEDPQDTAWQHFCRESGSTIPLSSVSRVQLVSQSYFPHSLNVGVLNNCYAFFINDPHSDIKSPRSLEETNSEQRGWFNVQDLTSHAIAPPLHDLPIGETVTRVIQAALTSDCFQNATIRSEGQVWYKTFTGTLSTATQTESTSTPEPV